MTTTIDRTLADIVLERPDAARVLEDFGLDYCCGGHRTLAEACEARDIDAATVVAALLTIDRRPPADWTSMGPVELVDHLEATHHAYLHGELARLDALAEKVAGVHGSRHPELAEILTTYRELRADLEPHLRKEEQVLFPLIRRLAAGTLAPAFPSDSVAGPVSVMLTEHERVGTLLARLRDLTGGYSPPSDGCASYRALVHGLAELEDDTHLHVHKENNRLFPAVVALEQGVTQAQAS